MTRRVVVVGGGLAGLAAAVTAADGGWAVTVLESRPRLGGATHSFSRSFEDAELIVDNGQHVFLRCCTAYRAFLRRLGVEADTHLQPRLDVPVVDPTSGTWARLKRDRLPAPLHLARALLTYRVLSPADRARAIWGALRLRFVDRDAAETDTMSFGDWLRAHGQTPETIERLFDVFTVATLNAAADHSSLRLGAMVFQDGLLRHADACDIGYATVPLGVLHGDAAHTALAAAGAQVHLQTRVRSIERVDPADGADWAHRADPADGADRGHLVDSADGADRGHLAHPRGPSPRWRVRTDDHTFDADAVVLATSHDVAARLLPRDDVGDAFAATPANLDMSPILNVHVVYDRKVLAEPFVAAVGSPVQFVFDRTHASGLKSGQYVAVSVSAAAEWIDQPVARLREVFEAELATVLPAARQAVVRDFFVTRERAATFRPAPGSAAFRLPTATPAAGLVVAGAWTDTGWPATMEGAVRSGVAAAKALGRAVDDSANDSANDTADDPNGQIRGMGSPANGLIEHDGGRETTDCTNSKINSTSGKATSGNSTSGKETHGNERAGRVEPAEEALA